LLSEEGKRGLKMKFLALILSIATLSSAAFATDQIDLDSFNYRTDLNTGWTQTIKRTTTISCSDPVFIDQIRKSIEFIEQQKLKYAESVLNSHVLTDPNNSLEKIIAKLGVQNRVMTTAGRIEITTLVVGRISEYDDQMYSKQVSTPLMYTSVNLVSPNCSVFER
jgi:hypothetical protein